MAEINNNNIPSFGYKKIEKIEKPELPEKIIEQENKPKETQQYVQDTGVLGRSQVRPANGGNIPQTVNETVELMKTNPAICGCCEGVFDTIYNDLIAQGKNPDDAYMKALFAEEELLEICPHN